jgi:GntR family transcriptional regulator
MGRPNVGQFRPEPLYIQIEEDIRRRIETGEWLAGTRLPSEQQLCDLYRVSRITVRQAVRNLADRGVLALSRGRGTFVRDMTLTAGARGLTSFTQEMQLLGRRGGSRVLSLGLAAAEERVARELKIPVGRTIVILRRLRLADGQPLGLQTAHLPADLVPGLETLDFSRGSLYDVLREHYGLVPREAVETFRVERVSGEEAELLDLRRGECAFAVSRITSGEDGPFEFTSSIMSGRDYQVRLVLRANQ